MKTVFILFCMACSFGTCTSQTPPSAPVTAAPLAIPTTIIEDPYFTVTEDTISTQGPVSITRNVMQDKQGRYWFATWQGIMSYDGVHFVNHTLKAGLRKFHVFALMEDSRGYIWFGTIRGGVYQYDPLNDVFTLFTTEDGLINDMILCFLEDRDGNIWIGTDEGLSVYSYTTNSFTNYTVKDGLSGHSINSIAEDKNGTIWFATRFGSDHDVCYFKPGEKNSANKLFTPFSHSTFVSSSYNARSVIEDKKGNIWIGSEDGLFRYKPSTGIMSHVMPNFIGYIMEDTDGILWLGHAKNIEPHSMVLDRYDPSLSGEKAFTILHEEGQVFGITEDAKGDIWFGTINGVCKYDKGTGKVKRM